MFIYTVIFSNANLPPKIAAIYQNSLEDKNFRAYFEVTAKYLNNINILEQLGQMMNIYKFHTSEKDNSIGLRTSKMT